MPHVNLVFLSFSFFFQVCTLRDIYDDLYLRGINGFMYKSVYVVFTTISAYVELTSVLFKSFYVVVTTISSYEDFTTICAYVELTSVMFKSLESETRNPKPETQTQNPKPHTRTPKPQPPNPKPETQTPIFNFLLHIFQTPYLILSFVVIFNECYG